MTRMNQFHRLRRVAATLVVGSTAGGGLAIWLGYGRPLCREVWRRLGSLSALDPDQAMHLITVLMGG